jgi:hypothetical protein
MSKSKPTIILVHGGFYGPECFKSLVPLIKDAGYPSIGDLALEKDVEAVRSLVTAVLEEGNNCIRFLHSAAAVLLWTENVKPDILRSYMVHGEPTLQRGLLSISRLAVTGQICTHSHSGKHAVL